MSRPVALAAIRPSLSAAERGPPPEDRCPRHVARRRDARASGLLHQIRQAEYDRYANALLTLVRTKDNGGRICASPTADCPRRHPEQNALESGSRIAANGWSSGDCRKAAVS